MLIGEAPTGPFTVPEIHAKLAAQEAAWQTPACPVGGGTWLPLVRTPGIGPATTEPARADHDDRPRVNPAPAPQPAPAHLPQKSDSRGDGPEPPERPNDSSTLPTRSGLKRVVEALGGLFGCLLLGGIIWRATCAGDGAGRRPPTDSAAPAPADYRPFLRDGKVVPTGHASLDYWVHLNVFLDTLKGPQNDLMLPSFLRNLAKGFRARSTTGVDADLVRWGAGVAALLDARADIVERLNDPGTLRHAREEVAAGRPNPLDDDERSVANWQREQDRLRAEGQALRETLSRRHARTFPPPLL